MNLNLLKIGFIISGISFFAFTSSAFAGLEEAVTAMEKGDYKTALLEAKPLAEQDDPKAQYILGVIYFEGNAVSQDNKEAARWFRKSAEQGLSSAQFNLSNMYRKGQGVPLNLEESFKWAFLSAKQGDYESQYIVGISYFTGLGVPENYVEAYAWLSVASANGYVNATEGRDTVASRLTSDQLKEAQKLSKNYFDAWRR